MKIIVLTIAASLSLCLASEAALPTPKSIEGKPFMMTKTFVTQSGNTTFKIIAPQGWGIGEMSATEAKGKFALFPIDGGFGCLIYAEKFIDANAAQVACKALKASYRSSKAIKEGFETEIGKGWFSCRSVGGFLINTWYIGIKKNKENADIWNSLKECATVSVVE